MKFVLAVPFLVSLLTLDMPFRSEDKEGPISLLVHKGVEVRVKPVSLIVNRSDETDTRVSHTLTPGRDQG